MRRINTSDVTLFLGKIGTWPVVMGILNVTAIPSPMAAFRGRRGGARGRAAGAMHGCDQDRLDLGRLLASATGATVRMAQSSSIDGQVPTSSLPKLV